MGRPSKYDWESIELDYKSGLSQAEIHKKHNVPYNRLSERVKKWEVSEDAKSIIKGFDSVSEQITELKAEQPELTKNVLDIVTSKHPEFKIAMMKLSTALFNRMDELIPIAEASEIPQLAKGMQTVTDTIGITERHAPRQVTAVQVNTDEKKDPITGMKGLYGVLNE